MGAFFNNLDSGDITLPWASIAGFADAAAVIVAVVILALRHEHRLDRASVSRAAQPHSQPTR